jgi:hypothetical protein
MRFLILEIYPCTKNKVCRISSPTRGVFAGGGRAPADTNTVRLCNYCIYRKCTRFWRFNCSNLFAGVVLPCTRGIFAGSNNPTGGHNIDYITIATTGNAQEFGDLTGSGNSHAGTSNSTRGVFAGGSIQHM